MGIRRGLPDFSLIEPLSRALNVFDRRVAFRRCVTNRNRCGNMAKSRFLCLPGLRERHPSPPEKGRFRAAA
jgi:hypothetical protein